MLVAITACSETDPAAPDNPGGDPVAAGDESIAPGDARTPGDSGFAAGDPSTSGDPAGRGDARPGDPPPGDPPPGDPPPGDPPPGDPPPGDPPPGDPGCVDLDQDGYGVGCPLGPDCDDTPETGASCQTGCDTFFADSDLDGFGDPAAASLRCLLPSGYVTNASDCDDTSASVRPGRDEIPHNGVDNNCNGDADEALVFDMAMISDPATAECTWSNHRTVVKDLVLVDLWDVSYVSWESLAGELHPILIRGYASRPVGARGVPGVVRAHGLGGWAGPDDATGLAALLGTFALAYTGPGQAPPAGTEGATSEGLAANDDVGTGHPAYRLFDTLTDIRGTWFWGHAVAAMRGLTCVASHVDVDASRLGVTGYSGGGIATLLAAGADPRIVAAVPLSSTVALDVAIRSPNAWQHDLMLTAGLTDQDPEWLDAIDLLLSAPVAVGSTPTAEIMMVNGTIDEFFPLSATMATYNAIPTAVKRLSLAGNYDHGCYVFGIPIVPEPAATIEGRASMRGKGAQRLWFNHHFAADAAFASIPASPGVPSISSSADPIVCSVACGVGFLPPCTYVSASVDSGGSELEVNDVEFWWSNDAALNWGAGKLTWNDQTRQYDACFTLAFDPATTAYFVDAIYDTRRLLPEPFSLSSPVTLPAGHVPNIRAVDTCSFP